MVRDTVVLTREVRVEVPVEVANEPFTLGVVAFAIDSRLGKGTLITLRFPLAEPPAPGREGEA